MALILFDLPIFILFNVHLCLQKLAIFLMLKAYICVPRSAWQGLLCNIETMLYCFGLPHHRHHYLWFYSEICYIILNVDIFYVNSYKNDLTVQNQVFNKIFYLPERKFRFTPNNLLLILEDCFGFTQNMVTDGGGEYFFKSSRGEEMVLNTENIPRIHAILHISLMWVNLGSMDYVLSKEESLGSNSSF